MSVQILVIVIRLSSGIMSVQILVIVIRLSSGIMSVQIKQGSEQT
jgi:hypothetical protein